jgi:hypothetical protein
LNSIKSPAHRQEIEDNYTRIATFAKNCGAAFSTGTVVNATQTVSLNTTRERDRIGAECVQVAGDFSAKGQMIWELRWPTH